MAFVITSKCVSEVYAACQQVCPADCMHYVAALPAGYPSAGQPWMAIDPNECIDCGACEPECPVNAIFPEDQVPPEWAKYTELNARWFVDKASARATVDEWKPR